MNNNATPINLYVSKDEVAVLWYCVKYIERFLGEEEESIALSLMNKIETEIMAANPDSPYDALLSLSSEEASQLDFAIHMTMAESRLAEKHGSIADQLVGKVQISQLAKHIHQMADLLRRLNIAVQLNELQGRISVIEEILQIQKK